MSPSEIDRARFERLATGGVDAMGEMLVLIHHSDALPAATMLNAIMGGCSIYCAEFLPSGDVVFHKTRGQ